MRRIVIPRYDGVERFAGNAGEHDATMLVMPIPDNIEPAGGHIKIDFKNANGQRVYSEELTPTVDNTLEVKLWQQLTVEGPLTAQICYFDGDPENEPTVDPIEKSPVCPLRIDPSVDGAQVVRSTEVKGLLADLQNLRSIYPEYGSILSGMANAVSLNTAARLRLAKYSASEDDKPTYDGDQLANAPIAYETEDDLPLNPVDGLFAIIEKYRLVGTPVSVGVHEDIYFNKGRTPAVSYEILVLSEATIDGHTGAYSVINLPSSLSLDFEEDFPLLVIIPNDDYSVVYIRVFETVSTSLGTFVEGWNKITLGEETAVIEAVDTDDVPSHFTDCTVVGGGNYSDLVSLTPFAWQSDSRYSYGGEWLRNYKGLEVTAVPFLSAQPYGGDSIYRVIAMYSNITALKLLELGLYSAPTFSQKAEMLCSYLSDSLLENVCRVPLFTPHTAEAIKPLLLPLIESLLAEGNNGFGMPSADFSFDITDFALEENNGVSWSGYLKLISTADAEVSYTEFWERHDIYITFKGE